ncbi:MAG: peptidase S10 [Candidatus Delongbacteria bacterium]|nr:peptidase S10 [Candidatus Delongbacteria bacterium]MBN2834428.1 peptidase S10 [Candidatus Delongbacteria bacterium]
MAEEKNEKEKKIVELKPEESSKVTHSIEIEGKEFNYISETGFMRLKDEEGELKVNFFFTSYRLETEENRPVIFAFNGGPGSSSVWLHMGMLGPKTYEIDEEGRAVSLPAKITNNNFTWLKKADLVFLDPVSTGYSRSANPEGSKEYHEFNKDIETMGDAIKIWLDKNKRWSSKKYLCGESYGTTRASGVSEYLLNRYGLYLNGIILVSSVLNFMQISNDPGNNLPFLMFLPTLAATSWYHGKLDKVKYLKLETLIEEVTYFVENEYLKFLFTGNSTDIETRNNIFSKISEFTGLSEEYVKISGGRINEFRYMSELFRSEGRTVGRLDSRFLGYNIDETIDSIDYDPAYSVIYGPYTSIYNDYVKNHLEFDCDITYEIINGKVWPWDYSKVSNKYVDVIDSLTKTMHQNPQMRVWFLSGYYDLATPYYATIYTINQMKLKGDLAKNIDHTYYDSGHMMYIKRSCLEKIFEELDNFLKR